MYRGYSSTDEFLPLKGTPKLDQLYHVKWGASTGIVGKVVKINMEDKTVIMKSPSSHKRWANPVKFSDLVLTRKHQKKIENQIKNNKMKKLLIIVSIFLVSCTKEEVKPVVQNAHAWELPYITTTIEGTDSKEGHRVTVKVNSNYPHYWRVVWRKEKSKSNWEIVHIDQDGLATTAGLWFPIENNKKYQYYAYAQLLFPQFYDYTDTIQLPK